MTSEGEVEVHEFDLTLPDGRTLHGYDTGGDGTGPTSHASLYLGRSAG